MPSIQQSMNMASLDTASTNELVRLLGSLRTDVNALATSLNQLITDYNANATIATDTTAAAVTLTTTV